MENKTIIIETNTLKKGKLDRRSFTCRVFDEKNRRVYVLDETRRDVRHKHVTLTPGCRIIDGNTTYTIKDIWHPSPPKYPHLIVDLNTVV